MRTISPIRATVLCLLLGLTACVGPLERPEDDTTAEEPSTDSGTAAVVSLIDQARLAYERGEYDVAIAVAERGLRIDRREPELYLLLAQSYLHLARPKRAGQFAQQGMRYSPPNSPLYQALEAVKRDSSSNDPNTLRF
ncbi:tetratricopeptide repeat protein [Marinimicrobium sp. C2-29]|uniref:tetratricopeptide repeat protein n=1 Tax=Marinimicrobium sp. C2-29 TaxID=3139825 RepID=UPI003139BF13